MGVHQRIDRVARRHMKTDLTRRVGFPNAREILHFEGKNGPDGIKRKSPGVDEPWHFIDPYHEGGHDLFDMMNDHIANLAEALRSGNRIRAAFEAAWLAHAIVDGLTPAHHYPYEEKLETIRGQNKETRDSVKGKMVMPGRTRRHKISNNWQYWGAKGLMTTHLAFEFGVATTITSSSLDDGVDPTPAELEDLRKNGFEAAFRLALQGVAAMDMYEEFVRRGWNRHLALETREVLMPRIIKAVMLGWYTAIFEAEKPA